jgi:hypothetical protein
MMYWYKNKIATHFILDPSFTTSHCKGDWHRSCHCIIVQTSEIWCIKIMECLPRTGATSGYNLTNCLLLPDINKFPVLKTDPKGRKQCTWVTHYTHTNTTFLRAHPGKWHIARIINGINRRDARALKSDFRVTALSFIQRIIFIYSCIFLLVKCVCV